MKKKAIISSIAIILILTISINAYRAQGKNKTIDVTITHLEQKNLKSVIMVPGTLKLSDEEYIYLDPEKGDVDKIQVTEGSKVRVGTPVITYKNPSLDLEQQQNILAKRSNQIQIDSINSQINNLDKKQKELEKEMGKEEAQSQIASERSQLNLDLKTAKLDLEKSELETSSITKKEEDLEVKSRIDGTVLEVNKEAVNNKSDVPKPILHIGNTNEYLARGVLSEYDALDVKIGQPVTITSDVLPNKNWTGTVKQIDYLPQQQVSSSTDVGTEDTANQYPVEVKIDDKDINVIKPGFKLLLQIEKKNKMATALPIKSIINKDKKHYVYIVKDNKAVLKEIKIGETTNKFIEILNGISAKEKVITNPSTQLTNGSEVNIQ